MSTINIKISSVAGGENMKKTSCILLFIITIMLLCSCTQGEPLYKVEKSGIALEVNKETNTIYDGTNMYYFNFAGNKTDYEIEITYPDGSTYWCEMDNGSGNMGWSNDYDPGKYIDGDILVSTLLEDAPKASKNSDVSVIAILVLIILGVFNIVSPQFAWYLQCGWRYKDAEPSGMALVINRVGGVVIIIIGLILLIV